MLKVLDAAQAVALAQVTTNAFFGLPINKFALEGWAMPVTTHNGGRYTGSGSSWNLSAAELIGGLFGGNFGIGPTASAPNVGEAIKHNLLEVESGSILPNGAKAAISYVLIPMGFKAAKTVLAKPLINPINRGLKRLGVSKMVVL